MVFSFVAWLVMFNSANAQSFAQSDSSQNKKEIVFYQPKKIAVQSFIIPVGLMATGALGTSGKFIIPDGKIKAARDRNFATFHTSLDNYLQFAPMAAGYVALYNNKEHSFWKYTEKVVVTEVVVTALVQAVKHIAKVPRPDDGSPTSFPSGHTAQAFAGATIFSDEFAQHNVWLTASAYASATAVGVLRILNNRHWASDVIAGAGFGMASAKLSEWIVQPRRKKRAATFHYQF
ncbi:MAG: phosphatase PAP2 family protein [Bacteroidota bacterium]|nr:phosphatase PAP2 family protein [Bacteroidota bacterium]